MRIEVLISNQTLTLFDNFGSVKAQYLVSTASGCGNESASLDALAGTTVNMIDVLHIINGEHFSGAERVQQNLGLRLEQFGYKSHFACLKPGKFFASLFSPSIDSIGAI